MTKKGESLKYDIEDDTEIDMWIQLIVFGL